MDNLIIFSFGTQHSAKESHYIVYMLQKYQDSNDYYLAKYATLNRHASNANMYMRNELFIPYVEDFQVILKDKEGKILVPVCNSDCGPVEDSQGNAQLLTLNMVN